MLSTVTGFDRTRPLAPPEICPGLDLPVWRFLERLAPDWLLPGVGQLPTNSVVAVQSNPAFIDAFLVGLNTQLLDELRWRNVRIAAGCTPVRTFWQRISGEEDRRVDDIVGIHAWVVTSELGSHQHRPAGLGGDSLVLVFRGQLLLRYPQTLIYLVPAPASGRLAAVTTSVRVFPSFQGRIGEDVTYVGFEGVTPPSRVRDYWVALEEPPAGYHFSNFTPPDSGLPEDERSRLEQELRHRQGATDGAEFADRSFADPVRVFITGASLQIGVPG